MKIEKVAYTGGEACLEAVRAHDAKLIQMGRCILYRRAVHTFTNPNMGVFLQPNVKKANL